jgi:hypothetical protein
MRWERLEEATAAFREAETLGPAGLDLKAEEWPIDLLRQPRPTTGSEAKEDPSRTCTLQREPVAWLYRGQSARCSRSAG